MRNRAGGFLGCTGFAEEIMGGGVYSLIVIITLFNTLDSSKNAVILL